MKVILSKLYLFKCLKNIHVSILIIAKNNSFFDLYWKVTKEYKELYTNCIVFIEKGILMECYGTDDLDFIHTICRNSGLLQYTQNIYALTICMYSFRFLCFDGYSRPSPRLSDNPDSLFPCPVTFVTGQRLLGQGFPDSAGRICTVGSATQPSSRPLRLELATGIVLRVHFYY